MSEKVIKTGNKRVLKLSCGNCEHDPSISSTPACLNHVIQQLQENASIDKVLLEGKYVQEYRQKDLVLLKDFTQTLEDSHYFVLKKLTPIQCSDCKEERKTQVGKIWTDLRRKPSEGVKKLKQIKKDLEEKSQRGANKCKRCRKEFLKGGIKPALEVLSANDFLEKFQTIESSNNELSSLFDPITRPSFLRSKIKLNPPKEAELTDAYEVNNSKIRIYYSSNKLEHFYFLIPPEYRLSPTQVDVLQEVRGKLLNQEGSLDPPLAEKEIEKRSRNLIMEVALQKDIDLGKEEIDALAKSLSKFTAGLGIIETLLADPKIQDIYIDAPVGENPIYIYHQEFEECLTNLFLTPEDAKVLTSRFRAISGRPFSEANPTLDLDLENIRIAAIQEPLSPDGLAFAIRRHKSTPWTLPLFVKNDFLTPKAAGLLSLLVDSQASILVTGSRGAGKTSLLGALMLELLPKFRILCLEDTAELPIEKLRSLGYKAQRLQVRPTISGSKVEMSTEDALRAALRLGESVLIMGEVRGPETKSLYEAMRVGAAGNSVMGTIHGSSAKDVFERVVFDLGIPASSFKATDAIVVASPIRSEGRINRIRRLTQISEVGKGWEKDPISENGFTDLMAFDSENDKLRGSSALEDGESCLLESISRKWSVNVSEVKRNLETRSKIQEKLVNRASSSELDLLGADFVIKSNLAFHRLLEEEFQNGRVDYGELYSKWEDWLDEESS